MHMLTTTAFADAVVAPLWLGGNVLVILAAWKLSRRLFPADNVYELVRHTTVLSTACVVAAATLLGAAGFLKGYVLLATVAATAVVVLLRLRHGPTTESASPDGQTTVLPAQWSERVWLGLWCLLLAYALGHVVTSGLLRFPTDFDSLMYHMPLVVQWLQESSLTATNIARWSEPGNNELLGLWMVAPFSGDFLISLNNLPATILLVVSAIELGRRVGLSHAWSHVSALAVVANTVVLRQLVTAENDVAVCSLFLTTLCYGLRSCSETTLRPISPSPLRGEGRGEGSGGGRILRPPLILGAISLGLLAGIKFYALGYAALAWASIVFAMLLDRGWRATGRVAAAWAVGAVVFGGYWYVRNAVPTGSPFYPVGLTAGTDAMSQIYPDLSKTSFLGNRRPEVLPLAIAAVWKVAGPLALVGFLAAPVTAAVLVINGLRWRRNAALRCPGTIRLLFGLLLVGTALVLGVTPAAVEDQPGTLNHLRWGYAPVRYGLSFLSLAILAQVGVCAQLCIRPHMRTGSPLTLPSPPAAGGEGRGEGRVRASQTSGARLSTLVSRLLLLLLAASAVWQLVAASKQTGLRALDSTLIGADIWMLVMIALLLWDGWPRFRRALSALATVSALACVAVAIGYLSHRWHREFVAQFGYRSSAGVLAYLADADPANARLCVLDHQPYSFFGSRRQLRVCQPVLVPTYHSLLEYLRSEHVTLVAMRPPRSASDAIDRFGLARRWVAEHPEHFRLVRTDFWYSLFQFGADANASTDSGPNGPDSSAVTGGQYF